jgi:L-2-hydroxyglutarate oxidase LhgO
MADDERETGMVQTDVVVIGGGIMGLSIARELAARYPGVGLAVLEKEAEVAAHASGRNSGVLHAGFYYTADSLKARFTRTGNRALTDYCLENGLPINRCGKVVVASAEQEVEGILELKRRGDRNGVELALVDERELAEIEPNARTVEKALFSPTTSTVDPQRVCAHLAARFPGNVQVLFGRRFVGRTGDGVRTDRERIGCRYVVNAAGLYADRVAQEFGAGAGYTMIPFKGIYLRYRDDGLLQRHVYPVPNLRNPFLGVHFTKTVDGHVKIGPTAIPAFWRENYDYRHRFDAREFAEIAALESFLFLTDRFHFRRLAFEEMRKYRRGFFIREARKLVNRMDPGGFGEYTRPGIRAQLLDLKTHELVMDFRVEHAERSTHVLNAVSPAFTCAFSFAAHLVAEAAPHLEDALGRAGR